MTLTDVHADPRLLAAFLNVPFEPGVEVTRAYPYGSRTVSRDVPSEEVVARAWGRYRAALCDDWRKRNPGQNWQQFVAECAREGLGLRVVGKLPAVIEQARAARPDLYQPPGG